HVRQGLPGRGGRLSPRAQAPHDEVSPRDLQSRARAPNRNSEAPFSPYPSSMRPGAVGSLVVATGSPDGRHEAVLVAMLVALAWSAFAGVLSIFSYWEGCDSVGCVGYAPILSQAFGWVLIGLLPAACLVVVAYVWSATKP